MVEEDKLTQLLSDLFPWQILCGFISKMVQSDLTVVLGDDLDQPKNMIFVNYWFKHVVVKLSKHRCQVKGPENGNSDCVCNVFAVWKTSPRIVVNILSKDFSASSEILMSLGVALKSLPLSLNSIKLEDAV